MSKRSRNKLPLVARWPFWLCLVAGLVGLSLLWQQQQISKLGARIKEKEIRLDELRRQNAAKVRELAMISSPREIEARIKRMGLELVLPQPDQIVRMVEPPSGEEPSQVVRTAFTGQPAR
ncbi:MAG TPA: hypothetical protein VEH27_01265 [Methylomirabilota bacterium]|nr:hypothetical protein [Methylomirabilota bacterium]